MDPRDLVWFEDIAISSFDRVKLFYTYSFCRKNKPFPKLASSRSVDLTRVFACCEGEAMTSYTYFPSRPSEAINIHPLFGGMREEGEGGEGRRGGRNMVLKSFSNVDIAPNGDNQQNPQPGRRYL